MAFRVLIPQDVSEAGKEFLRERGYQVIVGSGATPEIIQREIVDADAVLARTAPYSAETLEAAPRLKVVARHGVGVDNIDLPAAASLGIWVTNAPASNSSTVAEHTITVLLALAKRLLPVVRAFRAGDFAVRNRAGGMDVAGKTLGIIGMGRVGRLVAEKAEIGLSMAVIGYDPYLPPERFPVGVTRADSLDALLSVADFVTIHVPSTTETRRFIGTAELDLMKSSAYFINAARGDVVDEGALASALELGKIAGAALDVFAEEPPDPASPLLSLESVIPTPHNAALTAECMDRMAVHAAMGIDDVLSGRSPEWPVVTPRVPRL